MPTWAEKSLLGSNFWDVSRTWTWVRSSLGTKTNSLVMLGSIGFINQKKINKLSIANKSKEVEIFLF